jgi:hypothetical protein
MSDETIGIKIKHFRKLPIADKLEMMFENQLKFNSRVECLENKGKDRIKNIFLYISYAGGGAGIIKVIEWIAK